MELFFWLFALAVVAAVWIGVNRRHCKEEKNVVEKERPELFSLHEKLVKIVPTLRFAVCIRESDGRGVGLEAIVISVLRECGATVVPISKATQEQFRAEEFADLNEGMRLIIGKRLSDGACDFRVVGRKEGETIILTAGYHKGSDWNELARMVVKSALS